MSWFFDYYTCEKNKINDKQSFMGTLTKFSSLMTDQVFNSEHEASMYLSDNIGKSQCKHVLFYDINFNEISNAKIKALLKRLETKVKRRRELGTSYSEQAASKKTRTCKECSRIVYMDNNPFKNVYKHFVNDDSAHQNPMHAWSVSTGCPHCRKGALPFTGPQQNNLDKITDDISALREQVTTIRSELAKKMLASNKIKLKACVGGLFHESEESEYEDESF